MDDTQVSLLTERKAELSSQRQVKFRDRGSGRAKKRTALSSHQLLAVIGSGGHHDKWQAPRMLHLPAPLHARTDMHSSGPSLSLNLSTDKLRGNVPGCETDTSRRETSARTFSHPHPHSPLQSLLIDNHSHAHIACTPTRSTSSRSLKIGQSFFHSCMSPRETISDSTRLATTTSNTSTATASTDVDNDIDTRTCSRDSTTLPSSPSSVTLVNPTRTPSPSPLAEQSTLRKRVPTLRDRSDTIPSDIHSPASNMFGSRKYTPLPTSSNPQRGSGRRAGGGISSWKRWALIGGAVSLVIILGYSQVPSRKGYADWIEEESAENMYTPDVAGGEADEMDYSTPPFRPEDGGFDNTDAGEDKGEEEQMVHIQPIDEENIEANVQENPDDKIEFVQGEGEDKEEAVVIEEEEQSEEESESTPVSSPHDPLDPEAEKAEEAEPDLAEPENVEDKPTDTLYGAGESKLPTSFETDPDPSGTTACEKAYNDEKPLVQYALTIDAGSTGSRIHVYKFHNCGPSPELEYETFKMLNPGLSAFPSDPSAAAASLDPLLHEAQRVVPEKLHSCTPVEVKATAGLRLLGQAESDAILDEVRTRLETNFKFVVGSEHSVEIMDGKDEGVYAWITANYLAKKIGEGVESPDTLAVMDLGGASTQIVFEPKFPSETDSLLEGEHKYSLQFGGKEFTLYQHSYLGYGLMRARRSIHNLVAFTWSFGQGQLEWDSMSEDIMVPNPCLTLGSTRRVELDPPGRQAVNVTMHGGNGGFDACNRVVQLVMAKDA